ncbi:hypothetical protein SCUCBS95973_001468 [Sporothrix curviconia]|uniref:ER-bound oxygenase mpaB/mpaB'/Rubber oxygenase catalytic domain-containing protein n=1 Tax=Sporothrix curviconia TaxID=1260050 RepID=A0ABP0AYZ2_9PEZI
MHVEQTPGVLLASTAAFAAALRAHPRTSLFVAAFVVYALVCRVLRFRRVSAIGRQNDHIYTDRASLAAMTAADAQAILATIQQREFPFMHTLAIEFGIFKTYAIPSISRLVGATRQVTDPAPAAKRAADTVVILTEMMVNPPTSARSLQALARMNYLHSKYLAAGQIRNGDLLCTLAACITEPIRFIGRYEWRALTDVEQCALGVFWRGIGEAMGISYAGIARKGQCDVNGNGNGNADADADAASWTDGLAFVEDVTAWAQRYEREEMRPHPANIPPARRFAAMLLLIVPPFVRPFALEALTVLMPERVREAFAYDDPGLAAILVVYATLAVRRFVVRHLMLPRFGVHRVTSEHADPASGRVHLNEYLAHPWYIQPSFWNRWGPVALVKRATGGVVPGDARAEERGQRGQTYLPEGFLVADLGPISTMGAGQKEMAAEMERLKAMRAAGCPFG